MTYYEILEVSESASSEVISMAYKALVKKYHPDIFKGDSKFAEEQMKRINTAYEILSDPKKRKQYDDLLRNQRNTQEKSTSYGKTEASKSDEKADKNQL